MRHVALIFLATALLTPCAIAKDAPKPTPNDPHRTGVFTASFAERARESSRHLVQARLFQSRLDDDKHPDYVLKEETFAVVVPETYDPDTPHGLLVWISPGPSGAPAREWREALAKRKLIWVGANNAGNNRDIWQRLSLPLDAVHNMRQRYNLDEQRIYISGVSGGGRSSSRLGVSMADIFDGAMPIVGCDFYERIEVPGKPGNFYHAYKKPTPRLLNHAKRNLRLVILTGSEDYNRDSSKLFYQLYRSHGFKHATYLEAPGMEHVYPPAEWFAKGLDALDAPLIAARENGGDEAPADLPATENEKATKSAAQEKLDLANNYLDAGARAAAKRELNAIIKHYPDTTQARTAKAILKAMEAD